MRKCSLFLAILCGGMLAITGCSKEELSDRGPKSTAPKNGKTSYSSTEAMIKAADQNLWEDLYASKSDEEGGGQAASTTVNPTFGLYSNDCYENDVIHPRCCFTCDDCICFIDVYGGVAGPEPTVQQPATGMRVSQDPVGGVQVQQATFEVQQSGEVVGSVEG